MSTYKIKEYPSIERPRERLKEYGADHLTDAELLAILLKSGIHNKNVKELALELIEKYDYCDYTLENLKKISGIGEVKAIELIASIELGKRIYLKPQKTKKKLETASSIWEDAKYFFYQKKQEMFYCYYFDNKQNVIEKKLLFMGTINSSITHIRDVFREAYRVSAASIVCLHNHPSGDVTPSEADIHFTNSLIETGKIQGIPVIDHIIVGEDAYYSFFEKELLKNEI